MSGVINLETVRDWIDKGRLIGPDWTEQPKCPHCGEEDNEWHESPSLNYDGDCTTAECIHCGGFYDVEMRVQCRFTTKPAAVPEVQVMKILAKNHLDE